MSDYLDSDEEALIAKLSRPKASFKRERIASSDSVDTPFPTAPIVKFSPVRGESSGVNSIYHSTSSSQGISEADHSNKSGSVSVEEIQDHSSAEESPQPMDVSDASDSLRRAGLSSDFNDIQIESEGSYEVIQPLKKEKQRAEVFTPRNEPILIDDSPTYDLPSDSSIEIIDLTGIDVEEQKSLLESFSSKKPEVKPSVTARPITSRPSTSRSTTVKPPPSDDSDVEIIDLTVCKTIDDVHEQLKRDEEFARQLQEEENRSAGHPVTGTIFYF